jgi:hypothetical protein
MKKSKSRNKIKNNPWLESTKETMSDIETRITILGSDFLKSMNQALKNIQDILNVSYETRMRLQKLLLSSKKGGTRKTNKSIRVKSGKKAPITSSTKKTSIQNREVKIHPIHPKQNVKRTKAKTITKTA